MHRARQFGSEGSERTGILCVGGFRHALRDLAGFDRLLCADCRDVCVLPLDCIDRTLRCAPERRSGFVVCVVERQRQRRDRRERAHEPARPRIGADLVGQEAECTEHAPPRLRASDQGMARRQEMIERQALVHPGCQRAT